MKVLMRVMILFAAVLLVGNMAFANDNGCDRLVCYEITATDEHGNTLNDFWFVCLNDKGYGVLYSDYADREYNLYLFDQPAFYSTEKPGWGWSTWMLLDSYGNSAAHIWTQALGIYLQGAGVRDGTRYTATGKQVPCENGNGNGPPGPPPA
jgi:hypothetical protein